MRVSTATDCRIETIANAALSPPAEAAIARLKMQAWVYDFESQLRWLRERTSPSDLHLLIWEGPMLCAYARMVERPVFVPASLGTVAGLSTVCVDRAHRGLGRGRLLVEHANALIRGAGRIALLCCREEVAPFYAACGWTRFAGPVSRAGEGSARFFVDPCIMSYGPVGTVADLVLGGEPY